MVSPVVLAVPFFLIATKLDLVDTHIVLILLYLTFSLPIVVWICTDQFRNIPVELDEAARLDGASPWRVFWRINLPLAMPGIVVSAIFAFIFSWNDLLYALVLTRTRRDHVPRCRDQLHERLRVAVGRDHGDRHADRAADGRVRAGRLGPARAGPDDGRGEVTLLVYACFFHTRT